MSKFKKIKSNETESNESLRSISQSIPQATFIKSNKLKRGIESKPEQNLQSRKLPKLRSSNLLDIQSLAKEKSTKQWVESQRYLVPKIHNVQKKTVPFPQENLKTSEDSLAISIPDSRPLSVQVNKEPRRIDESVGLESPLDYHQFPPSSFMTPSREPVQTFPKCHPNPIPKEESQSPTVKRNQGDIIGSAQKIQIDKISSRNTLNQTLRSIKYEPKIAQASPSKFSNTTYKINAPDPIEIDQVDSGFDDSDPFGFIQAERQLAEAASTRKEEIHMNKSKPALSPDVQPVQYNQNSDISLGELLNINKIKKSTRLQSKKSATLRQKTPEDKVSCPNSHSSSSSLPRQSNKEPCISQRQERYPRKVKQKHALNLRDKDKKPSRMMANEESWNQAENKSTRSEASQIHEGRKESMHALSKKNSKIRKSRKTSSKQHHDENHALNPIVLIHNNKTKNSKRVHLLKPKINRHDSHINTEYDENQLIQDNPSPNRKSRLIYYDNLDKFSLEEEVIL